MWAYYNNADEVELFLNGQSQGIRQKQGEELHVMWRLRFTKGVVKVVSRKDGREVMEKEIRTAGIPHRVALSADRTQIQADGNDLAFITVRILDKDGNIVPDAENLVHFSTEGEGTITAVDNGDPTSHEAFQSKSRKAFHGLALVIIKSHLKSGEIMVTATSPGLQPATLKLSSR
jgi:beta-galactosidase